MPGVSLNAYWHFNMTGLHDPSKQWINVKSLTSHVFLTAGHNAKTNANSS